MPWNDFFHSLGFDSLSILLLALFSAFFLGISKAGFAGASLVNVLILATIFDTKASVGIILPLLVLADFIVFPFFAPHARWRDILPLLGPCVIGMGLGFYLLTQLDGNTAKPWLGGLVLLLILIRLVTLVPSFKKRLNSQAINSSQTEPNDSKSTQRATERVERPRDRQLHEKLPEGPAHREAMGWSTARSASTSICGFFAGIATTLANAAGPFMTLYMMLTGAQKMPYLGMVARLFLLINLSKVPLFVQEDLITRESLLIDAVLIPGVLLGIFLGKKLILLIPHKAFEWLTIAFSIIASIRLIFS